jgi:hypothetical protein
LFELRLIHPTTARLFGFVSLFCHVFLLLYCFTVHGLIADGFDGIALHSGGQVETKEQDIFK